MQRYVLFLLMLGYFSVSGCRQKPVSQQPLITGAENTYAYVPFLMGKSVALVCNHTSVIKNIHLVDTLLSTGIKISKIFSPEHGFRGVKDAGEKIGDSVDRKTGITVVSLYGKKKKPSADDLKNIDVVVFDIQDVGVRFYTYISTLHYVMEACAQNGIPVFVLDRPNPNGFYVDGPVMEKKYSSFVGLHPVPVVHGMTIGEYAKMINGEGWLEKGIQCDLSVIECKGYTHQYKYELKINPSPNLRNMRAIYLYPSLGLFEGTVMSIGRGTGMPFQVIGHPDYPEKDFQFIPKPVTGAENPKFQDMVCYGLNLQNIPEDSILKRNFDLGWLVKTFEKMKTGEKFFNTYFNYLAGNDRLKQQIISGKTLDEIRRSWENELSVYKEIRKKYLLYPDFE